MNLIKINSEVFIPEDIIVRIGFNEIDFLKRQAYVNPRKRARICAHKTNENALHEMLIVINANSYIHPHRHIGKSESFHVIEGEVDVAVFDDYGELIEVIQLGTIMSGRSFYYRLDESLYHTLLIRSEYLVLHEVTNGPFAPDTTDLADFAPTEDNKKHVDEYMRRLSAKVEQYLKST